ncbi:hypothetical protein KDX14_33160 [Burkholderia cenocepacia]|uniref:hypothetical protein n=1 Tax=Burkholderia cenocepacia TaxID=95486 RepID=UPI001B972D37|nr:hypothetical protein [Burkholderia cenocepacia]MBR8074376.1 hypothetical protein [Burkholderia cenocepacia]
MNQSNVYNAANIGLGAVLGSQGIDQNQKQMAAGMQPPASDTVRSLTERAHMAIDLLEAELGQLVDSTYPVREPMPCDPDGAGGSPNGPEVINRLRLLLSRIDSQMRTVRQITAELRI